MEVEAATTASLVGISLHSLRMLKVLLLVVMLVYLAQIILIRTRRWKSKCTALLPPGLVPWPIVGNLPEMLLTTQKPAFRWIHLLMRELGSGIACIKLGGIHVIPITCPKIAQEVLRKQDANFASRPLTFSYRTFSGGYRSAALSPYGDQWKKMRRVFVSDIMCASRHRWLHDKRAGEANNLTRYVYNLTTNKQVSPGDVVDIRHIARHYCGNVIRRLLFNRRYFGEPQADGGPGPMEKRHVEAVFAALDLLYNFCVSDYLPWLLGLDLDGHEKDVKEANETVNRLHDRVIDERWRQWKDDEKQELEDLLDVLITLKDDEGTPLLSIEEVKAQSKVCRDSMIIHAHACKTTSVFKLPSLRQRIVVQI
jgi:tyrosine N-monooxygenase